MPAKKPTKKRSTTAKKTVAERSHSALYLALAFTALSLVFFGVIVGRYY